MTRRGKIARLPRALRDELNQRIEDGETGARLVEWLNGRDDVQGVMKIHFNGRPINEQNVSDWRAGGYADWQEQQATFELANGMMDEGAAVAEAMAGQAEPGAATGGRSLADHVGDMAALALAKMLRAMRRLEDGPEQWELTLKIVREVVRLRKSDREHEDALRRRETHEQYEAQARMRAQARAKSPSERLEEILAERRGERGDMTEAGGGETSISMSASTSMSTSAEGRQAEVAGGGTVDRSTEAGGAAVSPPEAGKSAEAGELAQASAHLRQGFHLRQAYGGQDVGQGPEANSGRRDGQAGEPARADKHGVCKTGALRDDDPRGEGAAAPSEEARQEGAHLRQGYGGQGLGQASEPAVAAVPQEPSRSIKVDRRSRTEERWIGPWRVGSWG